MKEIQKVKIDNNVELAYEFVNIHKENSPLLIFLHEGLGSIAQWKSFPRELCEKLNLKGLVYERYGYGHSTPLQEERKSTYLDVEGNYFLPKLIENLNLSDRELILVGHSDGASISLIYAALFPEKIKAVISIAAHVFNEQISIDSIKKLELLYEGDPKLKRSFEKYHFDHTDSTFYAFSKTITHADFKEWNIEHYLTNIVAPIFAIQGYDDEYGTELQVDSIITKSQSKNNRKLMIQECGHSPHLEKQAFVINQIDEFYKSIRKCEPMLTINHE